MGNQTEHRPRRIIAPAPAAPAPSPAPVAKTPLAERFQRALLQTPRAELRRERSAKRAEGDAARPSAPASAPAGPDGRSPARAQAASTATPGQVGEPPRPPPVPQPSADDDGQRDAPDWRRQLAGVIATLCARADPAFENWSVIVPLDARVLPETELRLTLSPHALLLRFHTLSPGSHRLVSAHRSTLHQMLLETLPTSSRDIDIDVT